MLSEKNAAFDDYEELDLSRFSSMDEQIEFLKMER